jgi:hypothetical protein
MLDYALTRAGNREEQGQQIDLKAERKKFLLPKEFSSLL